MQRAQKSKSHPIAGAAVFLLIAVFAIMSMLTVSFSVQAYSSVQADLSLSADVRLMTGYITAKLRAGDTAGAIQVLETDAGPALSISSGDLTSVIYVYDGKLTEDILDEGDEFDPENGVAIASASSMHIEKEGQLIRVNLVDAEGSNHLIQYYLHTQEGQP
ncbi:MAG: DUF4860 domain-containing protein [Clostridia bacterium]|nr:DUF4860 domain-containing protein [Clostridia bacterium]